MSERASLCGGSGRLSRKPRSFLPAVKQMEICGPFSLRLVFNDGTRRRVNLLPYLEGPVFEPVRDPRYFRRVRLDADAKTVVWPNGADLAPEFLYDLPAEPEPAAGEKRNAGAKPLGRGGKRLPARKESR